MPLWIFTSAKLFPPIVCSHLQFYTVFLINLMTSAAILYILRQSIIQLCGTYHVSFGGHFQQVFHNIVCWWVFHWGLSDSKSPQVSGTLLSILKNVVVWMVLIFPCITNSSCLLPRPLWTVQRGPITISTTVALVFLSFF